MFEYIINYIIAKYKVQNFNKFFVFGTDNENISIIVFAGFEFRVVRIN